MTLQTDLHNVLLEQLGYGELLSVRCFQGRRIILIILTSICLLPLILNGESRTAALQGLITSMTACKVLQLCSTACGIIVTRT